MTRHRDRLDLHWSRDTIPDRARLASILSRERLKDTSLDYADARQQDLAARHEAAEAMRERVRRRAAAFVAREQTRTGRMDNARSLLPASATVLQVARLALDAVERARLFRRRQSVLRQWARRMAPTTLPAPVRPVRPPLTECRAAVFEHDAASLAQLHQLIQRHAHERQAETTSRQTLRREATANWQALALREIASQLTGRYSGHLGTAWRASQFSLANDNAPGQPPPRQGPRPL